MQRSHLKNNTLNSKILSDFFIKISYNNTITIAVTVKTTPLNKSSELFTELEYVCQLKLVLTKENKIMESNDFAIRKEFEKNRII